MDSVEKKLIEISDDLQVDFMKSLEVALIKIKDNKLGGDQAKEIMSHAILSVWLIWLKQMTPKQRALLFEQGCDMVAEKILEISKSELYGDEIKNQNH